ncbi:MAG: 2-oxo-4-hydroxy-4-carboxy-5-ureidoimidazoline decarboxylase [Phormidesmis sp.]
MRYSIDQTTQMEQAEFVSLFGAVFEETPEIAEQAWAARPFADVADLHGAMVAVVEQMRLDEQLALIRAHPELGSKAKMADASVQEQASTGLDRLSPELYERLQALNATYQEKFGFPFVMAVKGRSRDSIFAALEARLKNERVDEIARSLHEITQIARFRLDDLLQ